MDTKEASLTACSPEEMRARQGVVVTADDEGLLKLFRWPSCLMSVPLGRSCPESIVPGRPDSVAFGGHSSHVANVIFTSDVAGETEYCVSAGGNDDTVMVWRHVLDPAEAAALRKSKSLKGAEYRAGGKRAKRAGVDPEKEEDTRETGGAGE